MTPEQYATLKPGCVIRRYSNGRLRTIVSTPKPTKGGSITGVGLVKVGHSWTNPNTTAWWDAAVIMREYSLTDRVIRLPMEVRVWLFENGKDRFEAVNAFYGRKVLPAPPRKNRPKYKRRVWRR